MYRDKPSLTLLLLGGWIIKRLFIETYGHSQTDLIIYVKLKVKLPYYKDELENVYEDFWALRENVPQKYLALLLTLNSLQVNKKCINAPIVKVHKDSTQPPFFKKKLTSQRALKRRKQLYIKLSKHFNLDKNVSVSK